MMASFLRDVTMRLNVSRKLSTSSMDDKEKPAGIRRPLAVRSSNITFRRQSGNTRISAPLPPTITPIPYNGGDDSPVSAENIAFIDRYFKSLENRRALESNFLRESKVDGRMRMILVDWMLNVMTRLETKSETWLLSVAILDRVTAKLNATRHNFQLIGLACLFIAAKYEEITLPHVSDLLFLAGDVATRKQLYEMEREVFKTVEFNLNFSCPLYHLRKFRHYVESKKELYLLARCCCEVLVINYGTAHWSPIRIAALSFYFAHEACSIPFDKSLLSHMRHTEAELITLSRQVAPSVVDICGQTQLKGLHSKQEKYFDRLTIAARRLSASRK